MLSRRAASGVPLRRLADVEVVDLLGCKIGRRHVNADAADGDRGALSPSAHHEAGAGAQIFIRICAARRRDHAAKPGVGDGHYVHPDGAWLRLIRPWCSLVQPSRAVVARIDHHGGGVLRRDAGGCSGSSRKAGHLQYGPGFTVHGRGLPACSPTTALRSAWTARAPARQRLRRTAVAQRQVRGGVSQSLRHRVRRHAHRSRATSTPESPPAAF